MTSKLFTSRTLRRAMLVATLSGASLSTTACLASAAPRGGVVYVSARPPRGIVEVVSVAPSRGYVWIPGYYAWRGNAYTWIGGRWELPPRGFRRWEPARWKHTRQGWFLVEGRWR